jgi:hypothetical protein
MGFLSTLHACQGWPCSCRMVRKSVRRVGKLTLTPHASCVLAYTTASPEVHLDVHTWRHCALHFRIAQRFQRVHLHNLVQVQAACGAKCVTVMVGHLRHALVWQLDDKARPLCAERRQAHQRCRRWLHLWNRLQQTRPAAEQSGARHTSSSHQLQAHTRATATACKCLILCEFEGRKRASWQFQTQCMRYHMHLLEQARLLAPVAGIHDDDRARVCSADHVKVVEAVWQP